MTTLTVDEKRGYKLTTSLAQDSVLVSTLLTILVKENAKRQDICEKESASQLIKALSGLL